MRKVLNLIILNPVSVFIWANSGILVDYAFIIALGALTLASTG